MSPLQYSAILASSPIHQNKYRRKQPATITQRTKHYGRSALAIATGYALVFVLVWLSALLK